MFRVFLLVVFVAVGMIVAIPLKEVYDAILGTSWPTGWISNYEVALLTLVPITFLIFVVFAGPARRVLRGGSPWGRERKEEPPIKVLRGGTRRWRQ